MKRTSRIVGLLVFLCAFSLMFIAGCATDKAVKTEATKTEAAKTEAIKDSASMDDILAEETLKSKKEFAAMKKAAADKKAAEEKLMAEVAAVFQDINFAFDRYDLNSEARNALGAIADWLSKHDSWVVAIEGHCDERGTLEYNLALGERRAEAAKVYLMSLGIAENRITTISYGEERPLDPRSNEEAWTKNRRDHFVATPNK